MKKIILLLSVLAPIFFMFGCSSSSEQKDLRDYMAETKKRPHGTIDPLPVFQPYQAFAYGAQALRSPFDKPVPVDLANKGGRAVEPDFNREREFLEGFNISSLRMVGTLRPIKSNALQALIDDGQGDVKRVSVGNYMGKNFGKISKIEEKQIELMEVVSDGMNGWVERPRIIKLEQKD